MANETRKVIIIMATPRQAFTSKPKTFHAKGGQNRTFIPGSVAGILLKFHITDPKRRASNPETDYVEVGITDPIVDEKGSVIKPTYDENGNPTTVIKMYCIPTKKTERPTRSIVGLTAKAGTGAAMREPEVIDIPVLGEDGNAVKGENGKYETEEVSTVSRVFFHGVRRREDGDFACEGCHGLASGEELLPSIDRDVGYMPPKKFAIPNAAVKKFPMKPRLGSSKLSQNMVILAKDDAEPVVGKTRDEKMKSLLSLFDAAAASAAGLNVGPAYAVVAYNNDPEAPSHLATAGLDRHFFQSVSQEDGKFVYRTGQEMYDDFVAQLDENHQLPEDERDPIIDLLYTAFDDGNGFVINVIPGFNTTKLHDIPKYINPETRLSDGSLATDEDKEKMLKVWARNQISSCFIYDGERDETGEKFTGKFYTAKVESIDANTGKTYSFEALGYMPGFAALSTTVRPNKYKGTDGQLKESSDHYVCGLVNTVETSRDGVAVSVYNLQAAGNGICPKHIEDIIEADIKSSKQARAGYFRALKEGAPAKNMEAKTSNESGLTMDSSESLNNSSDLDDSIPF